MKALIRFAVVVVVVAGLSIVADPARRATTVRVAVFLLASAVAVALVVRLRTTIPPAASSAFEPPAHAVPDVALPADLQRLVVDLRTVRASAHPSAPVWSVGRRRRAVQRRRSRGPARLPGAVRAEVRLLAAERLARKGLDLADPADSETIRALTDPALASALFDEVGNDPEAIVTALERL